MLQVVNLEHCRLRYGPGSANIQGDISHTLELFRQLSKDQGLLEQIVRREGEWGGANLVVALETTDGDSATLGHTGCLCGGADGAAELASVRDIGHVGRGRLRSYVEALESKALDLGAFVGGADTVLTAAGMPRLG